MAAIPRPFTLLGTGSGGSPTFATGTFTGGVVLTSTATSGLQIYNTADQVTNYERMEAVWATNVATLRYAFGGTGNTGRSLALQQNANTTPGNTALTLTINRTTAPLFDVNWTNTSTLTGMLYQFRNAGSHNGASGTINFFAITPTYNQASGTAANTDLLINRTETAVGSGAQNLLDLQVGGVSRFAVSNLGGVTIAVASSSGLFVASTAVNAPAAASFFNTSTGAAASTSLTVGQSTGSTNGIAIRVNSTGFTTSGVDVQDGAAVLTGTGIAGGLVVGTRASAALLFATADTERGGFSSAGVFYLTGQTSAPGAGAGTLTNAPSAGDPDFWLPVTINGTAHWIPAWAA